MATGSNGKTSRGIYPTLQSLIDSEVLTEGTSVWVHGGSRYDIYSTDPGGGIQLANGSWAKEISGSGGSGEVNTGSNVGTGEGVFAQKVGVDLEFKSIKATGNATISSDSDSITIDVTGGGGGEANTASNIGTGEGVFAQKSGVDLELKSLKATGGATISSDADSITIDVQGSGGDMQKATYDPTNVNGDAFDMDNMSEGSTAKILTQAERDAITANTAKRSYPLADETKLAGIGDGANLIDVIAGTNVTIDKTDPKNPIISASGGGGGGFGGYVECLQSNFHPNTSLPTTGINIPYFNATYFSIGNTITGASVSNDTTISLPAGTYKVYGGIGMTISSDKNLLFADIFIKSSSGDTIDKQITMEKGSKDTADPYNYQTQIAYNGYITLTQQTEISLFVKPIDGGVSMARGGQTFFIEKKA